MWRLSMRFSRRILLLLAVIFLVLLFFAVPSVSWADGLDDAARSLAQKVAATLRRGTTVHLEFRNMSSLSGADAARLQRVFHDELRDKGFTLLRGADYPAVSVTLSESLRDFLLVAEFDRPGTTAVVMVSVPRLAVASPGARRNNLTLEKEFVWDQAEPILDLALVDAPGGPSPAMIVLEQSRVAVYRKEADKWNLKQSLSVLPLKSRLRDLRGQILVQDNAFQVHLPGMECDGEVWKSSVLLCEEIQVRWRFFGFGRELEFDWLPQQNFFVRWQRPGERSLDLPPFFSAAPFKAADDEYWIFAATDGRALIFRSDSLFDEKSPEEPAAVTSGWGSEIASLKTDCGREWQVLATKPGDATLPDAITTYEFDGTQMVAVSAAVDLPGPVSALSSGAEGKFAMAIVRNLKTGRYEAYRLTVSCGR
jgi:hypothetical protein